MSGKRTLLQKIFYQGLLKPVIKFSKEQQNTFDFLLKLDTLKFGLPDGTYEHEKRHRMEEYRKFKLTQETLKLDSEQEYDADYDGLRSR